MTYSQTLATLFLLLLLLAIFRRMFSKKSSPATLAPFPEAWKSILTQKVLFYRQLSPAEQIRFQQSLQLFLEKVRITGVGTEVDDVDKLLVGASAVIPLFGFPGWGYRTLNEVLLYDGTFNRDFETQQGAERNILGMVGGTGMTGTMILSKPALHEGFDRDSDHHVGIHEFVHLLDRADGATDGIPEMMIQQPFLIPWVKMMHREIKAIQDGASDIDDYGSTNEAEFFSVVSEYFFKTPHLLEKRHPELFAMLERIFRQEMKTQE